MAEDEVGSGCSLVGFISIVLAAAIVFFVGIVFWVIPKIAIPIAVLFLWYMFIKNSIINDRAIAARQSMISDYQFPEKLIEKLIEKYPHISNQQANLVIEGLREFFHICNHADGEFVSMPSQAVDVVWHEFILFTKKYEQFCHDAFGLFLHHTPAEAMSSATVAQEGIKRAWQLSCEREDISPSSADKLPMLFALDTELNISDGFKYSLDCSVDDDSRFCASHIGAIDKGKDISGVGGCGG